jgi:hypothetical protein
MRSEDEVARSNCIKQLEDARKDCEFISSKGKIISYMGLDGKAVITTNQRIPVPGTK